MKRNKDDELKRNASGCMDPTAYNAMKNINRDRKRVNKLLKTIFYICKSAGFQLEERIVLKDMKTGKVWR